MPSCSGANRRRGKGLEDLDDAVIPEGLYPEKMSLDSTYICMPMVCILELAVDHDPFQRLMLKERTCGWLRNAKHGDRGGQTLDVATRGRGLRHGSHDSLKRGFELPSDAVAYVANHSLHLDAVIVEGEIVVRLLTSAAK